MANELQQQEQQGGRRQMVTDYSLGIFGTSDNFLMATQMAKALAASTIVPKEFQGKWENCLIAIEQAQRMGNVSPMMVMQNMYIVYGRPSWSSKFLIAMINNSGKYDQPLKFREEQKDGKPFACTAWTTLDGEVIEGMTVDLDIAKAEGWIDKNGSKWKTMPQLMLRYRAASFFSSLNCPEITIGLYTTEEAEEIGPKDIYQAQDAAEMAVLQHTAAIPLPEPAEGEDKAEVGQGAEKAREAASEDTQEDGGQDEPGF